MKLAIMQPYFFPYIGYFQLMSAVDQFVLYDNVQFIKDGWINRNRILVNGQELMFTLPLKNSPHTALINERHLSSVQWPKERKNLIKRIQQNYGKAPYFKNVFPLVEDCLLYNCMQLFDFIHYSICRVKSFLDINSQLLVASELNFNTCSTGQSKVLAICEALGANHYFNAIGGMKLYDRAVFKESGIRFSFIQSKNINYPQFNNEFVPWLSMIDVMMFNPVYKIQEYLNCYEVV